MYAYILLAYPGAYRGQRQLSDSPRTRVKDGF